MGEEEIRNALELSILAGYQLDQEAYEFLCTLAATEDPTQIISKAIQQMKDLKEKAIFIEKSVLERLVGSSEPAEEVVGQPLENNPMELHETEESYATIGKTAFHRYAKEVNSDINIIDDSGAKISSSGTIEDYLDYFTDRFKRLERLLRRRIDVKSATSVSDALRSQMSTRLKTVGMITDKREFRQKTILTIEDLEASATVLVPRNASQELQKKARLLMLDQVVCLEVRKTRSNLLIVEDITLPDVAQQTRRRASVPVYAVLTSDFHLGSVKFTKEAFNRFILWLGGKYGNKRMRKIADHTKYVLVAGDLVDGVGVYPNQIKELSTKDLYKQYSLASKYLEQIPDYIEVIITPGNHDAPRRALPQPPISNGFLETLRESRQVHSLGSPCYLGLHGVEVLVFHGCSLDDVISTVPNMTHEHPQEAMKLLLKSRHLAPLYGGKTPLSPESKDFLVIDRVPDIFHAGHIHSLEYGSYRGVLIVNSGCWQEQTDYMRRNGFMPTPGRVPVVNLQTLEVTVIAFC